ncbi:indole-3-glycerol-phosphate synthase [Candidatus Bathyarchaeota archaeon A05DMB-2]|jgi:indole-3-glycerol phosphate synthase|nr:indole-3-glycerol-phosphate synthase [Candidatus Bathyarchaeota archaeon A05DMB-2]
MNDFLDVLARDAKETIKSGYYDTVAETAVSSVSLKKAILGSKTVPVITEIKAASPSLGTIREDINVVEIAKAMAKGGAVGISVLTEPKHFHGSLLSLVEARKTVNLPILMKDIIISPVQLEAALKLGANAALLIVSLFDRGYCECTMPEMIANAHSKGLEVLLEAHSEAEFRRAVDSDADLVGINNRDLATLKVDLRVTERILGSNDVKGKIVVSESGVKVPADLRFLRGCGAKAFLIGSAVMAADNVEEKVKEFVLTS